jgi:galactokinase
VIGEHTDYNDGFVLPMAIDRYAVAVAAPRADGRLRVHAGDLGPDGRTVEVPLPAADLDPRAAADADLARDWAAYPVGVAWALAAAGHRVSGADVVLFSAVPVGSGLSSSASIECATLLALAGVSGFEVDAADGARLTRRAENDYAGVPSGPLDQLAAMHGEAGRVLFIDTRTLEVTTHPYDLPSAGLVLLVIDTRASHHHGANGYAQRRATCEAAAKLLGVPALRDIGLDALPDAMAAVAADAALGEVGARRVRHVVTEDDRVLRTVELLRAGRVREVGELLTASHRSLRDDYEVSCAELDLAVDTALACGAYGARMVGGGFGGSAIALLDADRVTAVTAELAAAYAAAGFTRPACFPAVAARGAHALR